MAEAVAATLSGLSGPASRKSSKSGEKTSSKKRHRESNHTEKSERKHKRSKSVAAPIPDPSTEAANGDDSASKRKRKSHKSSKVKDSAVDEGRSQDKATILSDTDVKASEEGENRSKRKKTHKEKKKRPKKSQDPEDQVFDNDDDDDNGRHGSDDDVSTAHAGVVVLDSSLSTTYPGAGKPSKHQYPFYTQTVSQYLPLHPLGINEPLHGYMNQHLEPLLNRYVPSFGGVLLAYRNPRIGEAPGKASLTEDSGIDDTAVLESVNEAAVSFGWLTVEVDIFRPSRGAWLEGLVNIQSGGHIGVVCWGKFNASIESERLPHDWRWVDQHASKQNGEAGPEATSSSLSEQSDAEADHTEVHATGYWVDGQGSKVTAETPICFRIKNYEVGSSGDYGYLSIEGTMLAEQEEQEKARKERDAQKRKLGRGIVPRRDRRPLLELGMTKFSNDDGREPESQRTEA
ncbi:hypothetical protein GQX73_g7957 [Xylaria multiplex]|uniref:DNA-directed RNA polymerase subunit n=1 Tax=Xylaria multiplex TaxID=323545 RepID=A0A7C8IMX3_9PEZI|nr:hypothetical protein GQX73_g7957 [Xylaria multiplex]